MSESVPFVLLTWTLHAALRVVRAGRNGVVGAGVGAGVVGAVVGPIAQEPNAEPHVALHVSAASLLSAQYPADCQEPAI